MFTALVTLAIMVVQLVLAVFTFVISMFLLGGILLFEFIKAVIEAYPV